MSSISQRTRFPRAVSCQAASATRTAKRVLIIGGTGRVGSSAAESLSKNVPGVELTLAGRSEAKYEEVFSQTALQNVSFQQLDIEDESNLKVAVEASDLVIHAAGPFQRRDRCHVLEAAIVGRTAYLDVCDDMGYSQMAKRLHPLAVRQEVPCIVGGGVYPGLSNVMAAHIVSTNKKEYDPDGFHQAAPTDSGSHFSRLAEGDGSKGSGGAGKTLLVTSLMLLGESVLTFKDGKAVEAPAMSQPKLVDFGPGIGQKDVHLLNLPEVYTAHTVLGARNASARFGTSPVFWNWLLWAMACNVDPSTLQNRESMSNLASLAWPITRFVDRFTGEAVGMRVDVDFDGGKSASGIYVHTALPQSIGTCVGAFAQRLLKGETQPGVWYPEEKEAMVNRRQFLKDASEGCQRLILNRPGWQIESDPTRIALGIYVY